MPLPALLNDHVLLSLPEGYYKLYHDRARTAPVVTTAPGSSPPAVGDTVAFAATDATEIEHEGTRFLIVDRKHLLAVTFPAPAKPSKG